MSPHRKEIFSDLKEYVISFHKQTTGYKIDLRLKLYLTKFCKITSGNIGSVQMRPGRQWMLIPRLIPFIMRMANMVPRKYVVCIGNDVNT